MVVIFLVAQVFIAKYNRGLKRDAIQVTDRKSVCAYVCMCLCVCVCVYVYVYEYLRVCVCVCVTKCACVHVGCICEPVSNFRLLFHLCDLIFSIFLV